jgi:hypothetical protein
LHSNVRIEPAATSVDSKGVEVMLNPTEVLADALSKELAAGYTRAFSGREPRYTEVIAEAARLILERIGSSESVGGAARWRNGLPRSVDHIAVRTVLPANTPHVADVVRVDALCRGRSARRSYRTSISRHRFGPEQIEMPQRSRLDGLYKRAAAQLVPFRAQNGGLDVPSFVTKWCARRDSNSCFQEQQNARGFYYSNLDLGLPNDLGPFLGLTNDEIAELGG